MSEVNVKYSQINVILYILLIFLRDFFSNRLTAKAIKSVISRDVDDGNFPNYCQSSKGGGLVKSSMGFALCNYCGLPLHKRQNCFIKSQDRIHGLDRIVHPGKSSNMWKAQNSLPWHKQQVTHQ